MNPISNASSPPDIGVLKTAGLVTESSVKQPSTPSRTDMEVVSAVIKSADFKPSSLTEVTQPSREVVAKAAQQIQSFVESMGRNFNFSIDESTGYHVVTVVNPETNEVVRQLPSEELLRIAQSMKQLDSFLVNQKA